MKEYVYLSDDELEALIKSAEDEQVVAPEELLSDIISRIEEKETVSASDTCEDEIRECKKEVQKPPKIVDMNIRKAEFRRYCIRVLTSVAAAIIFLFAVPSLSGSKDASVPGKETVLSENCLSKEEVIQKKKSSIMGTVRQSHMLTELYHQWKE